MQVNFTNTFYSVTLIKLIVKCTSKKYEHECIKCQVHFYTVDYKKMIIILTVKDCKNATVKIYISPYSIRQKTVIKQDKSCDFTVKFFLEVK